MIGTETYRPINDDHAIQGVKFSLAFSRPFSNAAIRRIAEEQATWTKTLPAFSLDMVPSESGPRKYPTAVFAFLRPDGTPNWALQIGGNLILVECSLYSRWKTVWEVALGYINSAVIIISKIDESLEIQNVELVVRDMFISTDPNFDTKSILKADQPYICQPTLEARSPWHSNTGWFVPNDDGSKYLVHINSSASVSTPGADEWTLTIEHLQQYRFATPVNISKVASHPDEFLSAPMENMHANNKKILLELLSEETIKRIALEGPNK